jgi:hypothetical protein
MTKNFHFVRPTTSVADLYDRVLGQHLARPPTPSGRKPRPKPYKTWSFKQRFNMILGALLGLVVAISVPDTLLPGLGPSRDACERPLDLATAFARNSRTRESAPLDVTFCLDIRAL